MKGIKNVKLGFTLLELLVVVLIIGILADIALPQYKKSVWKADSAELLTNGQAIESAIDRYLLAKGDFPSEKSTKLKNLLDIDLQGGNWNSDQVYETDKFEYNGQCYNDQYTGCEVYFIDKKRTYTYYILGSR